MLSLIIYQIVSCWNLFTIQLTQASWATTVLYPLLTMDSASPSSMRTNRGKCSICNRTCAKREEYMDSTSSPSQPLSSEIKQKERNMHFSFTHKCKYVDIFLAFASILVATGTLIWVLNIVDIIPGPWSSVFGAVFAGVGTIIALFNAFTSTRRS